MRIDRTFRRTRLKNQQYLFSPAQLEYFRWPANMSGVSDYSRYFEQLLPADAFESKKPLENLFLEQKRRGKSTVTLELMGYGKVLMELEKCGILDGGVAVALSNPWEFKKTGSNAEPYIPNPLPQEEKQGGTPLDIIAGDVLSNRMWRALAQWLEKNQSEGFDFVLFAPGAGANTFCKQERYVWFVLQQVYRLLSSNGGMLYADVPSFLRKEVVEKFCGFLEESDIPCKLVSRKSPLSGHLMRLTRVEDSPPGLPLPKEESGFV